MHHMTTSPVRLTGRFRGWPWALFLSACAGQTDGDGSGVGTTSGTSGQDTGLSSGSTADDSGTSGSSAGESTGGAQGTTGEGDTDTTSGSTGPGGDSTAGDTTGGDLELSGRIWFRGISGNESYLSYDLATGESHEFQTASYISFDGQNAWGFDLAGGVWIADAEGTVLSTLEDASISLGTNRHVILRENSDLSGSLFRVAVGGGQREPYDRTPATVTQPSATLMPSLDGLHAYRLSPTEDTVQKWDISGSQAALAWEAPASADELPFQETLDGSTFWVRRLDGEDGFVVRSPSAEPLGAFEIAVPDFDFLQAVGPGPNPGDAIVQRGSDPTLQRLEADGNLTPLELPHQPSGKAMSDARNGEHVAFMDETADGQGFRVVTVDGTGSVLVTWNKGLDWRPEYFGE